MAMAKFEIEIFIAERPSLFEVVDFDPWPDPDGYVRYLVTGDGRSSVVSLDTSYWESPCILTEQDAWDYLEKILYPEFPRVYSEESVFTPEELELIRLAIGKFITNKSH